MTKPIPTKEFCGYYNFKTSNFVQLDSSLDILDIGHDFVTSF